MQAIGVDLWNGTSGQLTTFGDATGATYPLLLNGATATGGNLSTLYGPWDNYIVINKQGIVRYHAANNWLHGNRYHLNEIRSTIDLLVSAPVGVEPLAAPAGPRLSASPNPFRERAAIELALPGATSAARVSVFDLGGRRIATIHEGPLAAGTPRFVWDGRSGDGAPAAPGVYRIVAELDGRRLQTSVVKIQ